MPKYEDEFVKIDFEGKEVMKGFEEAEKEMIPVLMNQIRTNSNEYVRMDTGALRASSYTASDLDNGTVIWDTPYASKVYYAGSPAKDRNPKASLLWYQKAQQEYGGEWAKLAQKFLDDNMKVF